MASSSAAAPSPPRRPFRHRLRRRTVRAAVAYALVRFVMWLFENRLVFFPVPATELWDDPPDPAIRDVFCASPGGRRIHAWWLPRRPDSPVLLLCPGNAGNLSGRGETLVKIRDRLDTSVLIFDYPGYGKSEGKPNEPNCYDAGEAAIRWLRDERHISPARVTLYGESLGGGVATEMARRYSCRALVLVKTFTSLPAAAKRHYPWLPVHWLMSNRFDNLAKLPDVHCPVFIASASEDRVVPYAHGQTLFAAAPAPKHFFRDDGSDHNDPLPDTFWDELRTFLDRVP